MDLQNRLRIYIAGPYTAPTEAERVVNTQRAIAAGLKIFRLGHIPYIPHLTHYVDIYAQSTGVRMTWDDYIALDLAWLEVCDALLYLGPSKGADLELQYATDLGKTIFRAISEIPSRNNARRDVGSVAERR